MTKKGKLLSHYYINPIILCVLDEQKYLIKEWISLVKERDRILQEKFGKVRSIFGLCSFSPKYLVEKNKK